MQEFKNVFFMFRDLGNLHIKVRESCNDPAILQLYRFQRDKVCFLPRGPNYSDFLFGLSFSSFWLRQQKDLNCLQRVLEQ